MTTPESDAAREGAGEDGPDEGGGPARGRWVDAAAVLSFALLAFWVTARFWVNPAHGVRDNRTDQAQFEWMMAHGARVLTDFVYPFASDRMNVPDGVNLMANTSVLSVSLPMTPITLLFGPRTAFLVFLTVGMFATGVAWYFLLSRVLVGAWGPAWLGAGFCAFAPAMVSHANAHPNIVSQFVVPLIIWRTLRLADPGRWLRNGVLLGLVIVWQAFLNLEILLMTAIGLGVVVVALAVGRPPLRRSARTFGAGLGVAAVVAGVLLAYPLYVQLFGPGAYQGLSRLIRGYRTDLASFVAWSRESVAGDARTSARLVKNATEENAFFGWPLAVLVVALVWWLRRNAVVLGLAAAGLIFALFSLGRQIRFDGRDTGIPGPWAVLERLPVLHSVVPTRWSVALTPIVGILLALGADHTRRLARRHPAARRQTRFATATVLTMALLPILPTPLPSVRLDPTPDFVTSGAWRPYVAGGHSIVTLPLPDTDYADPLRWSAETRLGMPLARGYFLYPDTRPGAGRVALFTAPPRPTSTFFTTIRRTDGVPPISPQDRLAALDDLRYWRAGAVILDPRLRQADALGRGMTALTGIEPVFTGGVWLWDVRPLVG
ncbi:hypothetical protein ONA91_18705 [Micromonospora sp. DR5-3]|uniref:hypothetical protein n=1 Tax=unclassified Micromonospora TaxID=2617518 RepID=UPI0011D48C74|nr:MULTISPECIES: hypothetical protein [unclassified Micromonospora]MCW3816478.1 hypothetical protein [Micromonospora sp. DR5-3]TYC21233.1 hypothetical protein FXF52_26940 [Micromonospora sp. MP36]